MILTFCWCGLAISVFLSVCMREIKHILREIILVALSFRVRVQSSSLWARLLTIPTSIVLIIIYRADKSSGLLLLLFIIIFIGGLLVLLIGVASSIHQEQAMLVRLLYLFFVGVLMTPILIKKYFIEWRTFNSTLFSWVFSRRIVYFRTNIVLITLGLLVISSLLMEFKGIIRKL